MGELEKYNEESVNHCLGPPAATRGATHVGLGGPKHGVWGGAYLGWPFVRQKLHSLFLNSLLGPLPNCV